MDRRKFVSRTSLALAAAAMSRAVPLFGQVSSRPKVVFFGMSVVRKKGLSSAIEVNLPALGNHATFAVAIGDHLAGLRWPGTPSDKIGLDLIHADLPGTLNSVACVSGDKDLKIDIDGNGGTTFSPHAEASLPNLIKLAKEFNPAGSYSLDLPTGTVSVSMKGGELRLPYQTSHAAATRGVRWRFRYGGVEKGDALGLTDMLVFESNGGKLDIECGEGNTTLTANQQLWLVNLPTYTDVTPDPTLQLIEGAHHVFELLSGHAGLTKTIDAQSFTTFQRDKMKGEFKHPCAAMVGAGHRLAPAGLVKILLIPPDTDPCFMTQV